MAQHLSKYCEKEKVCTLQKIISFEKHGVEVDVYCKCINCADDTVQVHTIHITEVWRLQKIGILTEV